MISKITKGQLSLEFLLLFAVFLALLGLWIPLINSIQEESKSTISKLNLERTLSTITSISKEICILGPENKRTLAISDNYLLRITDTRVELSDPKLNLSLISTIDCPIQTTELKLNHILKIENVDGKLYLSNS